MDAGQHDVQGSSAVLGGVDQNSIEKSRNSVVWPVVESVIVVAATAIRKTEELKALGGAVGGEGIEKLNNKEACEQRANSEVSIQVEQGSHKCSNNLVVGNVSESVVVIDSDEASRGVVDDGRLAVRVDEVGSSKVEEAKLKLHEAERESHVIDVKSGGAKGFDDYWEEERVCRICHLNADQSPDRKSENASCSVSMDLIPLGCECKDELGVAHAHCAEAWFKLKGNRICEICGETAKNVTGLGDNGFLEEWNERRFSGLGANASESNVGCWRGQPFCNFLMACLVIAFVLPWFFHTNMF